MGTSPSRPGGRVVSSSAAERLRGEAAGGGQAPIDLGPILASRVDLYPPVDSNVQAVLDACYDGAFQVGYRTDGHTVLTALDEQVASVSNASLLYGEVTQPGVVKVLDEAHLRGDRIASLMDLGCGAGKLCLQAFLSHPNITEVFGVEIAPSRHALAEQALLRLVDMSEGRYRLHKYEPGREIIVCEEDPYDAIEEESGGEHLHPVHGAGPCLAAASEGEEAEEASEGTDGIATPRRRHSDSPACARRCRVLQLRCGNLFDVERQRLRRTDAVVMETDIPADLYHPLCSLLSGVRPGCRLLTYLNLQELWPTAAASALGVKLPCPLTQCRVNVPTSDRFATSWAPVSGHHFFLWKRSRSREAGSERGSKRSSRKSARRLAAGGGGAAPADDAAVAELASAPVWRVWLSGLSESATADTPLVSLWPSSLSSVVTPLPCPAAAEGAVPHMPPLLERPVSVTLPAAAVCHALSLLARPAAAGAPPDAGGPSKPVWLTASQVLRGLGLLDVPASPRAAATPSAGADSTGSAVLKAKLSTLYLEDDDFEAATAGGGSGSQRGLRLAVKPLVLPASASASAAASPTSRRVSATSPTGASAAVVFDPASTAGVDGVEAKGGRAPDAFPVAASLRLPAAADGAKDAPPSPTSANAVVAPAAAQPAPGGRPRSMKKRSSFRFPSRRLQRLFAEPDGGHAGETSVVDAGVARGPSMSISGFSGGLAAGTGPAARDEAAVLDLHAGVPHDLLFSLPSTTTLQFRCKLGDLVWDAASCQVVAVNPSGCQGASGSADPPAGNLVSSWNRTLLAIALQVDTWYVDTREAAVVSALAASSGDAAVMRFQRRHSTFAGTAPPLPHPAVVPLVQPGAAGVRSPLALQRPDVAPTLVAVAQAFRGRLPAPAPSSSASPASAPSALQAAQQAYAAGAPGPSLRLRRHSWPLPVTTSWDALGVYSGSASLVVGAYTAALAHAPGEGAAEGHEYLEDGEAPEAGDEAGLDPHATEPDFEADGDDAAAEGADVTSGSPSRWKKPWLRLKRRKP